MQDKRSSEYGETPGRARDGNCRGSLTAFAQVTQLGRGIANNRPGSDNSLAARQPGILGRTPRAPSASWPKDKSLLWPHPCVKLDRPDWASLSCTAPAWWFPYLLFLAGHNVSSGWAFSSRKHAADEGYPGATHSRPWTGRATPQRLPCDGPESLWFGLTFLFSVHLCAYPSAGEDPQAHLGSSLKHRGKCLTG